MQITTNPDGSVRVSPVTPQQASALAAEMGVTSPNQGLRFDAIATLTVPHALAASAAEAVAEIAGSP